MKINSVELMTGLLTGLTEVFVIIAGAVGSFDAIGRTLFFSVNSFIVENSRIAFKGVIFIAGL